MLYGTAEQDPQAEMVAQLAQEMYHQNMLYMLVDNLNKIDFEVRLSRPSEKPLYCLIKYLAKVWNWLTCFSNHVFLFAREKKMLHRYLITCYDVSMARAILP